MPSIQIAFQGGGARFVEMLPIAHALLQSHKDGIICITRVAGSSAGSICAALIACQADFEQVRVFTTENGPTRASLMRRWCSDFGDSGQFAKVAKAMLAIWRAYRGTPLLNSSVLVNFLNELFAKAAPNAPKQIENLNSAAGGIKLVITGSDLSQSRGVVFDTGNLIELIAHSSAIPFAFRSFREVATSPYVDGGLCENLPVEQLLAKEDVDGPVFCVSIGDSNPQPYVPSNAKDYCLQLISASMNHNVYRAKRLVGLSNQLEEKSDLDTFAFEAAIKKLQQDSWYGEAYQRTMSKIHKIAQLYEMVGVPSHSKLSGRLSATRIMHSLYKVFETALSVAEWEYLKSGFVVRAECLQQVPPGQLKNADYIVRVATIRAKSDNLACFTSSAHLNDEGSIIPTAWTCYNETQARELPVQAVPVGEPSGPSGRLIDVLIFFENPSTAVARGDVLTIKSHFLLDHAMQPLAQKGSDYISLTNPHSIPVETIEAVLVYPATFGTVAAMGESGMWTPVSDLDLNRHYLSNLHNYRAVGATAQNVPPNGSFKVNFFKNNR